MFFGLNDSPLGSGIMSDYLSPSQIAQQRQLDRYEREQEHEPISCRFDDFADTSSDYSSHSFVGGLFGNLFS